MSKFTWTVSPEPDGKVVVTISADDAVIARVPLDEDALSTMITTLGKYRAQMPRPIGKLEPNTPVDSVIYPSWFVVPDVETKMGRKGIALTIRHPGMGWLGFLLEPEAAREMGELLLLTSTTDQQ